MSKTKMDGVNNKAIVSPIPMPSPVQREYLDSAKVVLKRELTDNNERNDSPLSKED